MRTAVLSDIHGNLTAFEAVLTDIRQASPDLVLHGGDLCDGGSSPVEVLDRIRDPGWQGVRGNGDQMLHRPESLEEFALQSSAPPQLWEYIREMAAATRDRLGSERLAWLGQLPLVIAQPEFALLHATPQSCWKTPPAGASDEALVNIYGHMGKAVVIYGHTHVPAIRRIEGTPQLLVNAGSVGLSYDGDARASYLILDGEVATIRRVEYSYDKELERLSSSALPHADWVARMLRSASPQLP